MIKQYLKHRKVCEKLGIIPFNFVEFVLEKNRTKHHLYRQRGFITRRGSRVTNYTFLRWD